MKCLNLKDGRSSNNNLVIEHAIKLGLEPASAIIKASSSATKIIRVLILDNYIEYTKELLKGKDNYVLSPSVRKELDGKLLGNSLFSISDTCLSLLLDKENYLSFIKKRELSTDNSLEDILSLSPKTIKSIKSLINPKGT